MHLTNAMQCESCSSDPDLTRRGKIRGREDQFLNYIMNIVFSTFPYQYKSMLNKYFFYIQNLFFIIPNQNYLSKHRLLSKKVPILQKNCTKANIYDKQ